MSTFVNGGITYNILTGSTVAVGNNQSITSTSVIIPNQVTNNSVTYTVVRVDDEAFTSNSNIRTINLSACSSLTNIGNYVFTSSSIQSVSFPSSLTTIGEYLFASSSIQSVTFPSSLTSIGGRAFNGTQNITSVDLSVCTNLTTIGNRMFANSNIQSVIFPSSLTNIGMETFFYCSYLKNITFTGPLLPTDINPICFDGIAYGVIAYMPLEAFKNPLNSSAMMVMTTIINRPILLKVLQSQMVCFKEDSKILTIDGYKPIQDLRKGDLVKTSNNDFKPIELIGKQSRYHPASTDERIKDQLYRCSQTYFPEVFDDLIITGCHSILVDELTEDQIIESTKVNGKVYITEGKYRLPACVDERTQVYEHPGMYTIYHLALENEEPTMNYGIYANGLLVESCSIRFMKELSMLTLLE